MVNQIGTGSITDRLLGLGRTLSPQPTPPPPPPPDQPPRGTEELIDFTLQNQVDLIVTQFNNALRTRNAPSPPPTIEDERGNVVANPAHAAWVDAQEAAVLDLRDFQRQLESLGFDTVGNPLPEGATGGGVSTANAQIAAQSQRERLAFDREQAERRASEFETTERRAGEQFATETSRLKTNTRIDTAIDMLEQSVARGEIGRAEADRRLRAAMDAATIQRDVLSDFGGFNLPAGTEFFPNLGPDSAFGGIFQGLTGQPFQGLETGGTFGVNPTALAQSVQQAGQGSVLPQLDVDIARARAEIAAAQAMAGSPIPATQPATQPRISPPATQNRLTF